METPEPLPRFLIDAFDGDRELQRWVGSLRPSWQREIVRHVVEPVGEATRQRRAAVMAERLLLVMQAEQELPPMLARPLRAACFAWLGWEKMSRHRRRDFLLTIFGARSVEARSRQIDRLVEACTSKGQAGKRAG